LFDRRKLDFVYATKLDFASREKRPFVDAAKLILWVDVRGEEVDFRRKTWSGRRFDLAG
jgi:hypothetical protein